VRLVNYCAVPFAALLFGCILFFRLEWAVGFLQAAICVLAIICIALVLRFHAAFSRPYLWIVPLCVAMWGLLQLAGGWTVNHYQTWRWMLNWISAGAALFLASQVLREHHVRQLFLWALTIFGFLIAIVSILQFVGEPLRLFRIFPSDYETALGPFANRGHFVEFLELLLPLALYKAVQDGRFLMLSLPGAMLGAIVISGSRSGATVAMLEATICS
jgi:hypothetical protein